MTRYTVVWHPIAKDLLAEIWLKSRSRREVSIASDAIDEVLAVDPGDKGQALEAPLRRYVVPPLEVFFEVIEPDRLVRVLHVRRTTTSDLGVLDGNGEG